MLSGRSRRRRRRSGPSRRGGKRLPFNRAMVRGELPRAYPLPFQSGKAAVQPQAAVENVGVMLAVEGHKLFPDVFRRLPADAREAVDLRNVVPVRKRQAITCDIRRFSPSVRRQADCGRAP